MSRKKKLIGPLRAPEQLPHTWIYHEVRNQLYTLVLRNRDYPLGKLIRSLPWPSIDVEPPA